MRIFLSILVFILLENFVFGQENETANRPQFENISNRESKLPMFSLSLGGGFSYVLFNPYKDYSEPFASHFSKLRKGVFFEGDGTFYFLKNFGLGFHYANFNAISKNENVDLTEIIEHPSLSLGTLKGNNNVNFLAPFISFRSPISSTKNNLIVNIGVGRVKYSRSLNMLINEDVISKQYISGYKPQKGDFGFEEKEDITSTTLGYSSSVTFEHALNKHFTIGFSVNAFRSMIKKFYDVNQSLLVNDGMPTVFKSEGHYVYDKGKFHNISRLGTSLRMAFIF